MRIKELLFAVLANCAIVSAANAAVLRLDATTNLPTVVGDFFVEFDDTDMDGLLSLDELLVFSGVDCVFCNAGVIFDGDDLTVVPIIAGFTDGASFSWNFFNGVNGLNGQASNWSYTISEVPLPAALPLFLAGLAGLGFVRRKRRKLIS